MYYNARSKEGSYRRIIPSFFFSTHKLFSFFFSVGCRYMGDSGRKIRLSEETKRSPQLLG
jgi:hypothetical protein